MYAGNMPEGIPCRKRKISHEGRRNSRSGPTASGGGRGGITRRWKSATPSSNGFGGRIPSNLQSYRVSVWKPVRGGGGRRGKSCVVDVALDEGAANVDEDCLPDHVNGFLEIRLFLLRKSQLAVRALSKSSLDELFFVPEGSDRNARGIEENSSEADPERFRFFGRVSLFGSQLLPTITASELRFAEDLKFRKQVKSTREISAKAFPAAKLLFFRCRTRLVRNISN